MDRTVCVIGGKWTYSDEGFWKFKVTSGQMGECMSIGWGSKFSGLTERVADVLGVDLGGQQLDLSFWYPGETAAFTQGRMPPITITSDAAFEQFKVKHAEYGGLYLYATATDRVGDAVDMDKSANGVDNIVLTAKDVDNTVSVTEKQKIPGDDIATLEDEVMLEYFAAIEATETHKTGPPSEQRMERMVNMKRKRGVNSGGHVFKDNWVDGTDLVSGENDDDQEEVGTLGRLYDEANGQPTGTCEASEDYDFDEWKELIDKEYPPSWDPFRDVSFHPGDEVGSAGLPQKEMEVGEASSFPMDNDEGSGNVGYEVDVPNTAQGMRSFVSEDLRNHAEIREDDPLLLEDAPPECDNLRGAPREERNMDLKRSSDGLYVGRIFANKEDMRGTLSLYAMKRLFNYRINKSDKGRVIANCVDKNCGWRIYATTHKGSENLEIRTVELNHTYDVAARTNYGEKATAKILAELLKTKFANGRTGPRACELPDMVLSELNVTISYTKAWNAKELAMAAARGNEEASYRFLSTYLHLLKTTNPGTITAMHTAMDKEKKNTLFKYLFFAFGASISGYKYLRKVIVIDGTAMKGKYKVCLVAASGQDGNMQIYPLAFGVVDGENEAGWVWFFRNLQRFVPDEEDLVFVSDRHASIYSGLRRVYPLAHHGACSVHLFRNVKHNFGCEGLAAIVSKAAKAYTVGEFKVWWTEIVTREPACAAYLTQIGLAHWTLSHFPGMRYNLMTSNISESLNAVMQKAVDYPIVSMVEYIRAMLMRWFYCRRTKAGKARTRCTPEIEALLIDHLDEAVKCAVLSVSDWVYQVNDAAGCVFTVDLENKTCSCRVFDVLKVPCCHALAARCVRGVDIYSLVDYPYFIEPWQKRYEALIMPVPDERDTDIPPVVHEVPVNPPKEKRGGGRPRKKRIPSQGEKRRVKKRVKPIRCGRCNGTGHNRKTCSNLI
ncbi:hypothetical protein CARUB_v10028135mg [Capsella rubella]|uniref:SWIM-type domain-containing protein n=1 Tax=Capsella rubella TaxID=81985 RepID=R0GR45_9BRAS|nr:hypothetical protein CARUB_v10028135mg [Capsella rubella]